MRSTPISSPMPRLSALGRFALPLVLLVVLTGCSPRPVHRLAADDPGEGRWHQGWQIRTASADGIVAEVAYVRPEGPDHVLWVRVINDSDEEVVVDPAVFEAHAYNVYRLIEARPETGRTAAARDPEAALLEADLRASRDLASAQTRAGLAAVSAVATTVAVVADPPDTDEEGDDVAYAYAEAGAMADEAAYDAHATLARQASRRAYWEGVLRRTTLAPGEAVEGVVHVPADDTARGLLFEVVVDPARVPFAFRQTTHRPGSKPRRQPRL